MQGLVEADQQELASVTLKPDQADLIDENSLDKIIKEKKELVQLVDTLRSHISRLQSNTKPWISFSDLLGDGEVEWEDQLALQAQTITNLRQELTLLHKDHELLQEDYALVKQELDQTKSEIPFVKKELDHESLKESMDKAGFNRVDSLENAGFNRVDSSENASLKTEHESLKQENFQLKQRVESLKQEHDSLRVNMECWKQETMSFKETVELFEITLQENKDLKQELLELQKRLQDFEQGDDSFMDEKQEEMLLKQAALEAQVLALETQLEKDQASLQTQREHGQGSLQTQLEHGQRTIQLDDLQSLFELLERDDSDPALNKPIQDLSFLVHDLLSQGNHPGLEQLCQAWSDLRRTCQKQALELDALKYESSALVQMNDELKQLIVAVGIGSSEQGGYVESHCELIRIQSILKAFKNTFK